MADERHSEIFPSWISDSDMDMRIKEWKVAGYYVRKEANSTLIAIHKDNLLYVQYSRSTLANNAGTRWHKNYWTENGVA